LWALCFEVMAMVAKDARRSTNGGKLAPIETVAPANTVARKIFSKKDLVESVRKMAQNGSKLASGASLGPAPSAEGGSQLKVMEHGVNANASKFNELKLEADRKTKELKDRLDALQSLKLENVALTQMKEKTTPEAQRIEELLEQIDETRASTEEKLHYRRQLQHMHRRLSTNQITFDAHINAMEGALQKAIKEHDDVKTLMRQLEAGKTKAVIDLHDTQRQVSAERRDRAKVISVRKMEAHNAKKMEEWRKEREAAQKDLALEKRGDLSAEEERALKTKLAERENMAEELRGANEAKLREFNSLEEQFTTIRQATGVNDLEEMVDKFRGQAGNRETLLKEQREVEFRLAVANKAKEEAERAFTLLKASGVGSNELNREVSDQLSTEIQAGRMELKVTRAACDRLENVIVALRQGAIGLFKRLEVFRSLLDSEDDEDEQLHQTNETSATIDPVEALNLSELILGKMMENVGGGGDTSPSRAAAVVPGAGDGEVGDDEETAQAAPDDVSSTWAALGNDDVPSAKVNVRVRTVRETQLLLDNAAEEIPSQHSKLSEAALPKDVGDSSVGDDDGATDTADIVPTRDFLKLSSSRQHAEVMRKAELELRRKKMQERYDAADDNEKEMLGSLADKKRRQRQAIEHLVQKKEMMGVPAGVTPKLDAMTLSTIFLNQTPELL